MTGASAFSSWRYLYNNNANLIHNSNSVFIMNGSTSGIFYLSKDTTFWDLTKDGTSTITADTNALRTISVAGDLTVVDGTLQTNTDVSATSDADWLVNGTSTIDGTFMVNSDNTFTANGAVTVNSGGTLGSNADYRLKILGSIVINTGGTLSAPNISGSYNHTGGGSSFCIYGTFIHNGGNVVFDNTSTNQYIGDCQANLVFSSLTNRNGGWGTYVAANVTVENVLNNTYGAFVLYDLLGPNTLTMGNSTQSGTIIVDYWFIPCNANTSICTITANSSTYPTIVKSGVGADFDWNYRPGLNILLRNINYTATGITGSGNIIIMLEGNNNTFSTFTISYTDSLIPLSGAVVTMAATNVNGTLGNNTDWNLTGKGAFTVSTSATFNAPNAGGTWLQTNSGTTFASGANLNHNNGTYQVGTNVLVRPTFNGQALHNFTILSSSGGGIRVVGTLIVENNFSIAASPVLGDTSIPLTLTMGTSSSAGTITTTGSPILARNNGPFTLLAADSAFPWTWTGSANIDSEPGIISMTDGIWASTFATGAISSKVFIASNMTFLDTVTISPGDILNISNGNLTVLGVLNLTGNQANFNDSNINTLSDFYISGSGNVTLTNTTFTNNTPTVFDTANLTVRWRNVKVVDEDGAALSGVLINVTQGGSTLASDTTGSDGTLQSIVTDYENIGGTLSLRNANISASKSGYISNSILDNVSASEFVITLAPSGGATSGYDTGHSVVGTPESSTTTPSVRVNGLALTGPWLNMQNVTVLDSGGATLANLTHNFSEGSLPISYLKINSGSKWVGISGRTLARVGHFNKTFTLQVPVGDAICNTVACIGDDKLTDSDCSESDYSTYQSTKSGSVCLAYVSSTVVKDKIDLTSIVSVPELDFVWVILIFFVAYLIFRDRFS
jgi:hypothetical protein